jgi:hypothetical protein
MFHHAKTLIIAAAIGGLTLTAGAAIAGQQAKFKDLVGGDAIKAFDTLTSRGFKSVETYNSQDGYTVTWWYNAKTGQCINTQSKDSKVEIADAGKYPKCDEAAAQAGGGNASQAVSTGPSKQAKKACAAKFGGKSKIKTVTALKPGWWEIILTGKKGRQVACTVDNSGKIGDWVEM